MPNMGLFHGVWFHRIKTLRRYSMLVGSIIMLITLANQDIGNSRYKSSDELFVFMRLYKILPL